MTALETLIAALSDVCAGLLDRRKTARRPGEYTMSDIGLSAFSLFFMGSASFLDYQRRLEEGHGRSNCQNLILLQNPACALNFSAFPKGIGRRPHPVRVC